MAASGVKIYILVRISEIFVCSHGELSSFVRELYAGLCFLGIRILPKYQCVRSWEAKNNLIGNIAFHVFMYFKLVPTVFVC